MSKVPHSRRPCRYAPKQTFRSCPEVLENRPAPGVGYFIDLSQERADGVKDGRIEPNTPDFVNISTPSASGTTGESDSVWVGFTDSHTDTAAARILASGTFDVGCAAIIAGGHRGRSYGSGSFDFTGTTAGAINLFAQDVTLLAASVNAFGSAGVGGMPNAQTTTLSLAA